LEDELLAWVTGHEPTEAGQKPKTQLPRRIEQEPDPGVGQKAAQLARCLVVLAKQDRLQALARRESEAALLATWLRTEMDPEPALYPSCSKETS